MNNVIINIKGKQKYVDSKEWDVTDFTTKGVFEENDNVIRIVYDESDMIGAENVKSEITVFDGVKAEIARTGLVSSSMMIEKGKRHNCFYSTPEGDFTIGLFGETVKCDVKGLKGEIYMKYTIDINSSLVSENTIEIKIKEIGQ